MSSALSGDSRRAPRWRLLVTSLFLAASWLAEVAGDNAAAANSADAPAVRIISLAPHLTELAYAAGAGRNMVGADAYSDYPEAARQLPRVGDAFQLDYERLLALRPDVVLAWDTGTPEAVIERLEGMNLRVERVHISRLQHIARAIVRIGDLAGTGESAARSSREFLDAVARLRARAATRDPVSVFYQISEKPLYTVNGDHLISEVIGLCGGENVFEELGQLAPAVSLESVLARDPEAIVTGDGAPGDPLRVWREWPRLRAVAHGNLYTVDADTIARPTPRIVEGARAICRAVAEARSRRTGR